MQTETCNERRTCEAHEKRNVGMQIAFADDPDRPRIRTRELGNEARYRGPKISGSAKLLRNSLWTCDRKFVGMQHTALFVRGALSPRLADPVGVTLSNNWGDKARSCPAEGPTRAIIVSCLFLATQLQSYPRVIYMIFRLSPHGTLHGPRLSGFVDFLDDLTLGPALGVGDRKLDRSRSPMALSPCRHPSDMAAYARTCHDQGPQARHISRHADLRRSRGTLVSGRWRNCLCFGETWPTLNLRLPSLVSMPFVPRTCELPSP